MSVCLVVDQHSCRSSTDLQDLQDAAWMDGQSAVSGLAGLTGPVISWWLIAAVSSCGCWPLLTSGQWGVRPERAQQQQQQFLPEPAKRGMFISGMGWSYSRLLSRCCAPNGQPAGQWVAVEALLWVVCLAWMSPFYVCGDGYHWYLLVVQ